jgi:hypothetical protein
MTETPNPLSETQQETLRAVLDTIVPASQGGRLPAAGALGLAAVLADKAPLLMPALAPGLTWLDEQAGEPGFAGLGTAARRDALAALTERDPGFLPGLVFHTYLHYYQRGEVLVGLGLEARPPYPGGYPLEENDLSLLDPVRERGRMYRDV